MKILSFNSPIFVILILFVWITLPHLNQHKLWQDEAETALIANSIIKNIVPKGTDGTNYFSQQSGAEYAENYIWRYHPWISFYIAAPSFALFGKSTLSARIPFYIFAALCLISIYFVILKNNQSIVGASAAALFLVSNHYYLNISSQCRYFTPLILFAVLCWHFYQNFNEHKRNKWFYTLSLLLLFHTHYLSAIILAIVLTVFTAVFNRKLLKKFLVYNGVFVLIHIPYLLWIFQSVKRIQLSGGSYVEGISYYLNSSLSHLSISGVLIIFGLALVSTFLIPDFKEKKLLFYKPFALAALALLITSFVLGILTKEYFSRYLLIVLPILAISIGIAVSRLSNQNRFLGIFGLFAILVTGDILDYKRKNNFKYLGPVTALINYFEEHSNEEDIIAISYANLPLAFYLPNQIIGAHQAQDWNLIKKARYIVLRQNAQSDAEFEMYQFCSQFINSNDYKLIKLPHADLPYECRETPEYLPKSLIKKTPPLVIYEKLN